MVGEVFNIIALGSLVDILYIDLGEKTPEISPLYREK
jgi:hypothetical protein